MRRGLLTVLFVCLAAQVAVAQWVSPRGNVTAYDSEDDVARLAYRESPYFMELTGSWHKRTTDSSVVYSRQLVADKVWRDYLVSLNVRCGHGVRVSLNGQLVGRADDSRAWNEFLLNKYLKYGKSNVLTVEALKRPQGALLEGEAEVGLNGEPYLRFKSDPGVEDFALQADYDAQTGNATLTVDARIVNSSHKGKYYVEVELWDPSGRQFDRMGRWVVFDKVNSSSVDLSRTFASVQPWTAETPALYTAVIRLRDADMAVEEVVGGRFGFRRVEVEEGALKVNGRPVTLKGVTYGIEHLEGDAGRQRLRNDLAAMKRANINAVRTADFSPMDEYFYELCDEFGLYVVCDANLLPQSDKHRAVATEPDMVPLFERRVDNMSRTLRNHPSIIAWSLGRGGDNGVGMAAAYRRLKETDPMRPVIFSGADFAATTDILGPVNPQPQALRATLDKAGERPVVMMAMGGGSFNDIDPLWSIVENHRAVQGGFLDCGWPLAADQAADLRQLFAPFAVSIVSQGADEMEVAIANRNTFAGFGDYVLEYTIFTSLRSNVVSGDLPVAVRGGESVKERIRLPQLDLEAGEEAFVRFDLRQRSTKLEAWRNASQRELGTVVYPLRQRQSAVLPFVASDRGLSVVQDSASIVVAGPGFTVAFSRLYGTMKYTDTLGNVLARPQLLFDQAADGWDNEVVASTYGQPASNVVCVEFLEQLREGRAGAYCDVRTSYTIHSSGEVDVEYTLMPSARAQQLPQPVIAVASLSAEADSVCWFGLDREVRFQGRHSGIPGLYAAPADGRRLSDLRWAEVHWGKRDAFVKNRLFVDMVDRRFSASLDRGLTLYPELETSRKASFRLRMVPCADGNAMALAVTECPRIESGIAEPPRIVSSSPHFSQPITVSLVADGAGELRYTLDGSDPTEGSPRYVKPFVLTTTSEVKARLFPKRGNPSFVAARRFNFDYIESTAFSRPPNTPYNVGADSLLFDGLEGAPDVPTQGWLGFSGGDLTVTASLSKPLDVQEVTVRFLHAPATWSFAPVSVRVSLSTDGSHFSAPVVYELPFNPADEAESVSRPVEVHVHVEGTGVRAVRIESQVIPRIPAWHRAKGLNPWLLMDEIEIIEQY